MIDNISGCPTTLDTSSDVKWMEYECDPTGGWLEHYGTEWDWLSFFWNLWADVDQYEFSVNQIMNVWNNVPDGDIAHVCCDTEDTPNLCLPHLPSVASCGSGIYSGYPYSYEVGKLWDTDSGFEVAYGVIDKAYSIYGTNMGANFALKGDQAGVDH